MIRKLQTKLIASSMLSLFIVLFVIAGIAGLVNYRNVIATADATLELLAENGGTFPETYDMDGVNELLESPELPYETRFFHVVMDKKGNIISTNVDQIAAVDDEDASEYARTIWEKGRSKGFVGYYRYRLYTMDDNIYIIFLDCTRSMTSARIFVVSTIVVSIIGLATVTLLMLLISGRIVKPFVENYEKQKRFITDAGHELKTPLTIINADAEILEMDFGENEWISDIQKQTKQLADLTNDLIVLSRMEEKQSKTQMAEIELSELVDKTSSSFKPLAKSQKKSYERNIEPDLKIHGDEKALGRLVSILLDNALKYSGEEGRIVLTLKKQRSSVILTVYNTADSVSKDDLPYLFDRFYRADQSRNSKTGGYGLGLSIAASTVNVHRGKITASTEDEKSLLITVTLPV